MPERNTRRDRTRRFSCLNHSFSVHGPARADPLRRNRTLPISTTFEGAWACPDQVGCLRVFLVLWCDGTVVAARQAGLSCERFLAMQAVILATSGTNSPHSRNASPWQACCCSGVP